MFHRFFDIFGRCKTPMGRMRLLHGVYFRAGRVLVPVAALYRRTLIRNTRVAAIVGSFGKTTTTRFVYSSLGLSKRPPRGWNLGIYLALELLHIRPGDRYGALEVGIGKKKMMARCARLVRPDIAVVTSIGSEHHKSLGTLEETRNEKADMVRVLPCSGLAALNGDDPNVLWMRGVTQARVLTFGFGESCDVRASALSFDIRTGMRFKLHAQGKVFEMSSRLVGRHQVYPLLAAVAVAVGEDLPLEDIMARIKSIAPVAERLEVMPLENGAFLLVDTHKSPLETVIASLETLAELPGTRKLVVLGEIEEPVPPQGPLYKDLGARLARLATWVVFIGQKRSFDRLLIGASKAGMSKERLVFAKRDLRLAADLVRKEMRTDDIVLIKGRGTQKLVRVVFDLAGNPISCAFTECKLKTKCRQCPQAKKPPERA